MGKGEIVRNEKFLLFPQCFLLNHIIVFPFVHSFVTTSLFAVELQEPKIGISGKGLKVLEHKIKNGYNRYFEILLLNSVTDGTLHQESNMENISFLSPFSAL